MLFEGLSSLGKMELIEELTKSLKSEKSREDKEKIFYESFGAFDSEKSADEIIMEIRENRKFVSKDLKL